MPVKALTGAIVTVEVPVAPALMLIVVGLAVTVKSVTLKVTGAVAVCAPFEADTVTV